MTKTKNGVTAKKHEGRVTEVYCVGECNRSVDMTIEDGLILKKLEFVCIACSKLTKYNMGTASATKVIGLPPGQMSLHEAADADDEGE